MWRFSYFVHLICIRTTTYSALGLIGISWYLRTARNIVMTYKPFIKCHVLGISLAMSHLLFTLQQLYLMDLIRPFMQTRKLRL